MEAYLMNKNEQIKVPVLLNRDMNDKFEILSQNVKTLEEKLHTYNFEIAKTKNQLVAKAAEIGINMIIQQFQESIDFDIMDESAIERVVKQFEEELEAVDEESVSLPNIKDYEAKIIDILQSKEDQAATPPEIYKKLADYFQLTDIQRAIIYQNTKRTVHENRCQFAVLNLRNRGILLDTSKSGRGIWKLNPEYKH